MYLGYSEFKILFCPYFLHAQPSSIVEDTVTHESEVFLEINPIQNSISIHTYSRNKTRQVIK